MTKAQIQKFQDEIETLTEELIGYVGEKQGRHSVWMIENSTASDFKVGGLAYFRRVRDALVRHIEEPRPQAVRQISPETQDWGGFMSHDICYVDGPSLRQGGA